MHIGLLPQGGQEWIAGVIYIQNIVLALRLLPQAERPQVSLFPYAGSRLDLYDELGEFLPDVRPFDYYSGRWRLRKKWYSWRRALLEGRLPRSLEALVCRNRSSVVFPSLVALGRKFPRPWIGWIPDFQHKHLPHLFPQEEREARDNQYPALIEQATHMVVSSRHAYEDLMRWFPVPKDRVSVFPFACVPMPAWQKADPHQIVASYSLPRKFLMFPSQFWVHKNHGVMFEAMRLLKARGLEDITLVCTGCREDYRSPGHFARLLAFIEEHNLGDAIHILGLLPRQDQIQLLRAAAAVVQPSLFEGWSALVEDARAWGKRIYVSDIPVHREQGPENAAFFRPDRPQELVDLIAQEWDGSEPGPDPEKERDALERGRSRTIQFARSFLDLAARVIQAGSG